MPHREDISPLETPASPVSLARWLLIGGTLLVVVLAFIPWMTLHSSFSDISFALNPPTHQLALPWSPTEFVFGHVITNPFFIRHLRFLISLEPALYAALFVPGLIGCLWVRGHITTVGQRLGVGMLTCWGLVVTGNALYGLTIGMHMTASEIQSLSFGMMNQTVTWTPVFGIFLALPAFLLFWSGMVLLWRDTLRTPLVVSKDTPIVEQQTWRGYLSAAFITLGAIGWFVGYFGIYWLLSLYCPPTRLFGSAPCNNRFSAQRGFEQLLNGTASGINSESVYWMVSACCVAAGVVVLVAVWLRGQRTQEIVLLGLWSISVLVVTGVSTLGVHQLDTLYQDEQWTNGLLVTVFGLIALGIGVILRWIDGLRQPQKMSALSV